MNTFSYLFLAMLALATTVEIYLALRQIRAVRAHRDRVPEAFRDRIELRAHQKGADYTSVRSRLSIVELLYGATLLLIWTFGGAIDWLDRLWDTSGLAPLLHGTLFLLSFFLINSLLDLPFTLYRTFGIEQRFGFNTTSARLFIKDTLLQLLLLLVIGTPLLALVLWLMRNAGELWWIWVWGVWIGFSIIMLWAYPAVIAPLFNKFEPLDEGGLKSRIEKLLSRCGFESNGIFVMDGSKRSSHGNAYFSGLGNNKRIVFFDTLLKQLNEDEIEAVLAHELGHFRRNHIKKNLLRMALIALIAMVTLGWLSAQEWFYLGLGVATPSLHTALLLFILAFPVFSFILQPLLARGMRKYEFEADDFAAEHASATDLIQALVKLYRDNASTLTPDHLYSAFHDSHPPAPLRIAHLSTKLATGSSEG